MSYILGGNLRSLKNQNFLCFGKNTCEVSATARENSHEISTAAMENPYGANAASKLSRKLRQS